MLFVPIATPQPTLAAIGFTVNPKSVQRSVIDVLKEPIKSIKSIVFKTLLILLWLYFF